MTTLKAYFGISDVALKKRFKTVGIPVPEGGFWKKRQEGYFLEFEKFLAELKDAHFRWSVPRDFDQDTVLRPLNPQYVEEAWDAVEEHRPAQSIDRIGPGQFDVRSWYTWVFSRRTVDLVDGCDRRHAADAACENGVR